MGKFYITTPIYYVNASPHLGHAYADVLSDVLARYRRLSGDEVFFLTGTDEHGAKNVRSAEAVAENVEDFVRKRREVFVKLAKVLNISNTDFIYTSDNVRHWPGAQLLWKKIQEKGDIYKGTYKGLYCVGHEAFITEKDLEAGKCPDHNEVPQLLEEENYFFRLSRYAEEIKNKIESGEIGIFPEARKNEILAVIGEGLRDVSFSRPSKDISWGIPVPGDHTQTMYVWCDALSNYLTALGYGRDDVGNFKKFWPADVHVIGKEILRFHAAIWPGMLLSAGLPLPKSILVHGLIQSGGRKMSKTLGNVVDPFELVSKYGAESLRMFFGKEIPVFSDGEFTGERFEEAHESNLVNGIGNYVKRVATMISNYFEGVLEKPEDALIASVPFKKETALSSQLSNADEKLEYLSIPYFIERNVWPKYHVEMKNFEINKAAETIFSLLKELDGYVQDYEPFKLVKIDKEKARVILWNLAYGAVSLAWMLKPFMPDTSDKILDTFSVDGKTGSEWRAFKIKTNEALFPRILKHEA